MSGNRLIVLADGRRNNSVVCYDKENGSGTWAVLSDQIGYSTPVLATFGGERQIIVCAQNRTVGLRLADGALLWEYPWKVQHDNLPIAQPVLLTSNRSLLSAGYFTGCAAVEVSSTGNKFSASTVWQNKNLKNKFTSSVVYQDYIYGLDEDTLTCISAGTGKRLWKEGRYGYGQVLLAGDYLIVLGGGGETCPGHP